MSKQDDLIIQESIELLKVIKPITDKFSHITDRHDLNVLNGRLVAALRKHELQVANRELQKILDEDSRQYTFLDTLGKHYINTCIAEIEKELEGL
jgi:hypothetical protein